MDRDATLLHKIRADRGGTVSEEKDQDEVRRERYREVFHRHMPGCTHDEHGADCGVLANAAIAVADEEHTEYREQYRAVNSRLHARVMELEDTVERARKLADSWSRLRPPWPETAGLLREALACPECRGERSHKMDCSRGRR